MAEEFPNGTEVVLKLPSDPAQQKRIDHLVSKTGVSFVYKVYGVVKNKNPDGTYNVAWNMRDSPDRIVTMDMDRSEIEPKPLPRYMTETATYGVPYILAKKQIGRLRTKFERRRLSVPAIMAVKERADHESLVNLESRANRIKSLANLAKRVSLVVVHVGKFRIGLGCFGTKINNNPKVIINIKICAKQDLNLRILR
jgi:hypothetical protein